MKVSITLEKTLRVCMDYDVTEEQLEQLKNGDNPFEEEMEKELETGCKSYDYTVCDEEGKTIIDWS